jgi:CRP-like cAMP-binding protein
MRSEQAATYARILSFKRAPFLRGLPTAELAVVAEQARERYFPKGRLLLREGERVPAVYFVVDGQVHVARRGRHLSLRGPGDGIGSLAFFARDPQGIEARAETDVVAYELDGDALLEIFEEHYEILHHTLGGIARSGLDLLASAPLSVLAPLLPTFEAPPISREPDLVERILVLRRGTGPFNRASINALAELSQGMAHVSYPSGVRLWELGEPSGSLLLVLGGSVRLTMAGGAQFTVGPGFPLGSMESVAERPRWFAAETVTRLEALLGNAEGMFDVFEDNPEIALDYLAMISHTILGIREGLAPLEEHTAPGAAEDLGA